MSDKSDAAGAQSRRDCILYMPRFPGDVVVLGTPASVQAKSSRVRRHWMRTTCSS
jgi:hypothetical protein